MPATVSAEPARKIFVFGDSLAVGSQPFLPDAMPDWRVRQDVDVNRKARLAPPALRARGDRLAPVVAISLGTVDDPRRKGRFRRTVRRVMRAVGDERCVVWATIWRPALKPPTWERLNDVLRDEAARRDNLVLFDWVAVVTKHPKWLSPWDATHVNDRGYRARARGIARAAEKCHKRLTLNAAS